MDDEIEVDPRITLVNETLTYEDLRKLKAGVDCYVSLHRSEGWGFGLIESMVSSTPVITTGYSGNMDFCSAETTWLVDYDEAYLGPNDYIFVVPGQKWAEPRFTAAVAQMQAVAADKAERDRRAAAASAHILTHFGEDAIAARYGARLREILGR